MSHIFISSLQTIDWRGWKLFYGNGKTFSSNDGTWADAPDQDVQVLLVYEKKIDRQNRPTRIAFSGCDFYFKDGDSFGQSFDDVSKVRGVVKRGKWASTEVEFDKIMAVAMEDYNI